MHVFAYTIQKCNLQDYEACGQKSVQKVSEFEMKIVTNAKSLMKF